MTRRELYDKVLSDYNGFIIPYGILADGAIPLKYIIIEKKTAYNLGQAIYNFQVYNYDTSKDFWDFVAYQYSFQSSDKEMPMFILEKVIDLDTGENVTEGF